MVYKTAVPSPRVSVVLPAHNEAATIESVVAGCLRHTPDLLEVLVIDDGSRDDTARLAEHAGARVVRLHPNRGKGIALREGVAEARGEVIVFLDADGQDDPAEIPDLLAALSPDVAMVIGSRFIGTFERGAISRLNRVATRAINGLFNLAFDANVTDTQAGFRAAWTDTLRGLRYSSIHYDVETNLLCQIVAKGGRVVEVAVRRMPRSAGETDFNRVRDGLHIVQRIATSWLVDRG